MSASTSQVAFFSSAASSFQPTPYTPSSQSSSSRPPARHHRSHDSLAVPPLGMDPQPNDPDVVFIHPPFTEFPGATDHPDGLTYALMAENPNWFLDSADFISQPGTDTAGVVPYPPHLEPPRGWCPAKKKDLKDRGVDGWPEGEEPRLRCTFCRRTYAGVNAKSMWRRHVFEKHKIAMSNRRDGNLDRPRGRGSGKENKQQQPVPQRDRDDSQAHESLVSIMVAPQTAPDMVSHKSRFRTVKPLSDANKRRSRDTKKDAEDEPQAATCLAKLEVVPDMREESSGTDHPPLRAKTPPFTPRTSPSFDGCNEVTSAKGLGSPLQHVPESPYNPLQTPSFRHSPPRLPSDQPWRFPSPSHPLHSTTRDLSLTMLSRPLPSPLLKGSLDLGSSAITMLTMGSSPITSSAALTSDADYLETPARIKSSFTKTIDKLNFLAGMSSSPFHSTKRSAKSKRLLQGSPLKSHRRQGSDISEVWFSASTPSSPSNDPFSIYNSWPPMGNESHVSPARLPKSPSEPESPVLRSSGSAPPAISYGINLLEAFKYPGDEILTPADDDLQDILLSPQPPKKSSPDRKRPASKLANAYPDSVESSPPLKKRRLSTEDNNA
ncbi:hypothetical protein D9613_001896 [Agrocybe pediades]|uniref:Uncharacterized protein n=1 Tax=Agrocybe pediades TaxID=84607 RepID=A0A8H4R6Q4_9AGAR|nr:hypothetical protein D9613_001896 [Agrocybe pediades]